MSFLTLNETQILLFPSKNSFLLAVILLIVLGEVCKVSDVSHRQRRCEFITTSFENDRFPIEPHISDDNAPDH